MTLRPHNPFVRPLALFFTCSAFLALATGAQAQEKDKGDTAKPEKVRFSTVDGVELHGTFYPGKKKAATVIMLHALGEDSRKKNWVSLAVELQKSGLNVLTFDFRGHGQSTDVAPETFWAEKLNMAGAGGPTGQGVGKRTIEFKNFHKAYYSVLCNDIAAARSYLERTKNDDGTCNMSSIILIGAETGATLGNMWMNAEWFRFKLIPPDMVGMQGKLEKRAEGKDIICAIWLSLSSKLGTQNLNMPQLIDIPARVNNTPMVFMFGDGDKVGKGVARSCVDYLKKGERNKFTAATELKGSKLTGAGLLQKSLGTEKAIAGYLEEVVDAKSNEWTEREFKKSQYYWNFGPNVPPQLIKPVGEMNLLFDRYDKFMPMP